MERHWKILLLISVGSFAAFLDAPVVSVAFPAIAEDFSGASTATLGWVLDGYFIAFAAFPVFAGKLADRYGRSRMFLGGVAAFTIASVVAGAAPSAGALIAARIAQGVAAGFMYPAGQSLMLAAFPPEKRKMALGVLAAVVGLAIAISPTVGGIIVDGPGWRWVFYINLAFGAAALIAGARLLRGEPEQQRRDVPFPDAAGALLQGGAVALVVLVILKYEDWGLTSAQSLAAIIAVLIALPVFVERSRRHPSPVLDLGLFRDRTFAFANLGSIALGLTFYGTIITAVFWMTSVWEYSLLTTGLTFIPGALVGAMVGGPAGSLSESRGPRLVAVIGSIVTIIGILFWVLAAGEEVNYFGTWLPGQILWSAGATAAVTALVGAAVTAAPAEQYANASGINLTCRQIGGAIGVAVSVAVTANVGAGGIVPQVDAVLIVMAVATAIGGIAALALRNPTPGGDAAAVPPPSPSAVTPRTSSGSEAAAAGLPAGEAAR